MARTSQIYVTAPEGRVTPVHGADGSEPAGGILYARPGKVVRVRYWLPDGTTSQTIRRSVNRGDLVRCNMDGAPVDSYELAAAPDEIAPASAKKEASK